MKMWRRNDNMNMLFLCLICQPDSFVTQQYPARLVWPKKFVLRVQAGHVGALICTNLGLCGATLSIFVEYMEKVKSAFGCFIPC